MPSANDMHKGMAIRYKGDVSIVLDMQHRTPGNLRAFVQATLRSLRTGKSSVQRFSSTESVEVVPMARKRYEFSYKDQEGYHFIEPNTYEDLVLSEEFLGDSKDYLSENLAVDVVFTEDRAATIELPASVTLKVIESADGVKGDSANNVMKPATVETGLTVQVPLFIKEGECIKISTGEGKYLGRA
jgi:elongation factor P